MVKLLVFFISLHLSFLFAIQAEESSCDDLFQLELQEFLRNDRQNFLGRYYAQSIFKVAALARYESQTNTEDFARRINRRLAILSPPSAGDEQQREKLIELYRRHGMNEDLMGLEESLQAASPWRASLRLSNESMAQLILAHSHLDHHSPFTQADAAIIWFIHQLLDQLGTELPPGSLLYNQVSLSPVVTRLLQSHPSGDELLASFEEESRSIQELLDQLYQGFAEKFGQECTQWLKLERCLGHSFLTTTALPKALSQLLTESEEAIEFLLLREFQARFPDGVELRLQDLSYRHPPERQVRPLQSPTHNFDHLPSAVRPTQRALHVQALRAYEEEFREGLEEEDKLHFFHRELAPELGVYGVIDRIAGTLRFFQADQQIYQAQLQGATPLSDRHQHGGGGIYQFAYQQTRGLFFLTDQRERNTAFRLLSHDSRAFELLEESYALYVLPIEEGLEFRLRDGRLIFTNQQQLPSSELYNLSPRQTAYRPLRTEITNPDLRNPTSIEFLATLDREKQRLMEIYQLDNDEYNELVRLSFGILGNESNFGQSPRYHIKEAFPWVVSLLKGDGLDTSQNSRGPTQIKNIPPLIEEHYGVTKSSLSRADHAAVATLGFLAQSLLELKNREHHHPGITPYNRFDYLHHIYMGRSIEITRGTATPERNIYFRNMRQAALNLVQWEELPHTP